MQCILQWEKRIGMWLLLLSRKWMKYLKMIRYIYLSRKHLFRESNLFQWTVFGGFHYQFFFSLDAVIYSFFLYRNLCCYLVLSEILHSIFCFPSQKRESNRRRWHPLFPVTFISPSIFSCFFFECWCIFPHLGLYLLVLLGPFFRSKLQSDVLSIYNANKRITGNFRPLMSIQLGIAWKDLRFAIRWKFRSPIFLSGMIFTISLYCVKNAPTCPEMKLGYLVNGDIRPSLSWLLHILARATLFSVGGGIHASHRGYFPRKLFVGCWCPFPQEVWWRIPSMSWLFCLVSCQL